ncbi:voltage-dependent potassium channel beta subunit [Luteibacter jiangsuensis]|uniref:Voltage-dependent potassium channel beta subunit n=1 Tax=Luteibacter jiangsuensis TaxID=637577 RepID=A0ABT9SY44_9GAMM|nr:aldo/keto reductase [Luteibacter jiangsuensis]MDQ0009916.1 voltage-dependent potassium channel beta subunit [Luteibacter jiangsuensis]
MEYRRLGSTGLKVSALSYGAWVTFGRQVGRSQARELIALAYDHGVNFFDNAETYNAGEAERLMGDVIADLHLPRDAYTVSSKVYFGASEQPKPTQRGLSRKHVFDACHQALERLRVDYLDMYFCHRADPDTPVEETVLAMDTLIRQGKVLYWGTSEWSAASIEEAHRVARERNLIAPSMEQPQYNLLHRERFEREYAPLYERYGMGTTIWSPLASGLLTGKYNDGVPDDSRLGHPDYGWLREALLEDDGARLKTVRALVPIAADLGLPLARFALAWCLKNPHVSTVILGASKTAQLAENLKALDALPLLDESVMRRIDAALPPA